MLEIEGLSKHYPGTAAAALDNVSLQLEGGEIIALIGPSGAGKSTLIRCINRLVEPTAGRIVLAGEELTALRARELRRARRRIGMVFQEFALVERLSVMENLLSGRLGYVGLWRSVLRRFPQSDITRAFELLERVGLEGYADRRADTLSGGQRQRVGIARALMQAPELLLVDEPTASLDPRTARQIMRLIHELCTEHKLPAIINLHDVPLAMRFCPRIIGLRGGRIVFDGPVKQLDTTVLTQIYGDEDWASMAGEQADDDAQDDVASGAAVVDRGRAP
ncbi:MAG: phosphonate ABC transporter ATP-binding protein [Gammaproteobacteria bacterium]|nr:phosphonate ABC transporter ATP-binding protein [Gammaproteobacteria bacterium]